MSLKQKTVSGMFWSLMQNVGSRGFTFIITIILARLLTPEAFGLIGMITIFVQVSQAIILGGFDQALIQKKDADDEDYSSVFWINFVISIFLYLIIFVTAPFVADFYKQPLLTNLVRVLCVVFVINAFSYVQEAKMSKEMKFKALTMVSIPSTIIGGVVSIVMAFLDFGVWSIVALQVITRLFYAIQIWYYAKWCPLFIYNASKVKKLFSFGGNLMVATLLNALFNNIYLIVIGKFFPLKTVGYYQNASNLTKTPSAVFSGAINKVTYPVFASIQDEDERLKQGYKKIIQQALFLLLPVFMLAAILAEPIFNVVLGSKWLPAVPFFQVLCVQAVFFPINSYNLNIVKVKGRSDLTLKLNITKKIIICIGIALLIPYGVFALVLFQSLNSIFMYLLNAYYSGKFIDYKIPEQIKDLSTILFLNIAVGITIFFLDLLLMNTYDLIRTFMGLSIGLVLYIVLSKLFKLDAFIDLKMILKSKNKKEKISYR